MHSESPSLSSGTHPTSQAVLNVWFPWHSCYVFLLSLSIHFCGHKRKEKLILQSRAGKQHSCYLQIIYRFGNTNNRSWFLYHFSKLQQTRPKVPRNNNNYGCLLTAHVLLTVLSLVWLPHQKVKLLPPCRVLSRYYGSSFSQHLRVNAEHFWKGEGNLSGQQHVST